MRMHLSGLFVALLLATPAAANQRGPSDTTAANQPAQVKNPAQGAPKPAPPAGKQQADASQSDEAAGKEKAPPTCKKNSDCPEGTTCKKDGKVSRCSGAPRPIPHVVT